MGEWPQLIVAMAFLGTLTFLIYSVFRKYGTAEEANKAASGIVGVFGTVIGAIGTYYFAAKPAQKKKAA